MARRIIVVGGGAAGMGAAGAAQGTDPDASITVVTSFEDAAYSPCGIPYVHGKEIPDFERLFMTTKQHYIDQGLDIRYETTVTRVDTKAKTVTLDTGETLPYDSLVLATGFEYADPGVPGVGDGQGLYYVKNIREAMERDKALDSVQSAVVIEAGPLGAEMVTALAERGIDTHLVDPGGWAMSMATDPDIIKPVEDEWREMGVHLHYATKLEAFLRDSAGRLRGVAARILRRYGEPADNPDFWAGISARTYFGDVTEPVLLHHGTADDTCPPRWSRETARLMRAAGVDVTLQTYPGEGHAFGPQFDLSMQRTDRFLRRHL